MGLLGRLGWIAALLCYESPNRVDKCIQTGHNGVGARPNAGMVNWKPPTDEAIRAWIHKVAKGADARALEPSQSV